MRAPPDTHDDLPEHAAPAGEPSAGLARERLNLIEQLTATSIASDYGTVGEQAQPSGRRERALVSAVAVGIAGLVIAMGVSARTLNAPVVGEQRDALRARIAAADQRGDDLAGAVSELRADVQEARAADLAASVVGRELTAQVAQYELVTGYTPVTGPGAVVTLTDAATPDDEDPALSRVLDTDLQAAVNGLWAAGAEAVSVNGQRLTARSAIRSAAGAILVSYRPLSPPYVVSAIGADGLAGRFDATQSAEQLRQVERQFGIGFLSESADRLALPGATTALPDQATVIEDSEGTRTP